MTLLYKMLRGRQQPGQLLHPCTRHDAPMRFCCSVLTIEKVIEKLAPHLKGYIPVSSEPSVYDAPAMQGAQMVFLRSLLEIRDFDCCFFLFFLSAEIIMRATPLRESCAKMDELILL